MHAVAPIENHGVIGDLRTVALVAMDGTIDFFCFPNFDSPSVFASLLDPRAGGSFRLAPVLEEATNKQIYIPDTNVLLSRFLSEEGVAEVSDFMPVCRGTRPQALVRRAKCVRGEVHFRVTCAPRFDYARATHDTELAADGHRVIFASRGDDGTRLRLRSEIPLTTRDGAAGAEFTLRAGEHAAFVLEDGGTCGADDAPAAGEDYVPESFKATLDFWRGWLRRSQYSGRWREIVNRSALVLKLLTSREHGSIVASPTFGLPEEVGGVRNWDYRYTWIRDASFTLYGLIRLGYTDEAGAFMHWIEDRCSDLADDGSLQIMYGIDGRKDLPEAHLDHLAGYRDSRPVRVGNGAHDQLQLDIYGELMDSVYLYNKYGEPISYDLWHNLVRLIDWVCDHWHLPDEGIWEVRGGRREFAYSRLMCWVALDRGVRLALKRSFPAPLDRWIRVRDTIYRDLFENFWNPQRRAFVQFAGSSTVDASTLLMPLVKFVGPTDPRWLSTLRAIETDLLDDSLVYRYRIGDAADDGLHGDEGTFSMCTFWFVECLGRAGDLDRARFILDKMLGYANHLGLYGEELGPRGEHLGNFPQAFTHLGLISAVFDLNRRLDERRGR